MRCRCGCVLAFADGEDRGQAQRVAQGIDEGAGGVEVEVVAGAVHLEADPAGDHVHDGFSCPVGREDCTEGAETGRWLKDQAKSASEGDGRTKILTPPRTGPPGSSHLVTRHSGPASCPWP